MTDRIRKIIIQSVGGIGSGAAAILTLLFSGAQGALARLLLATLAGTLGNIAFTLLATWALNLHKRRTRGRPGGIVYSFGSFPIDDPLSARAGGKGRVLAKLYQAGFPVPDGCILLPEAFENGELSPAAWQQVQAQLARLRAGKTTAFAVRSSALQEDSARASFAGEFESVLDVQTDEEVRAALARVLQSGRSARVESYTRARGLAQDEQPLAVVIQKMVHPDFAGVLFTADPLSGSHEHMTGNYVAGSGEKLVSGQVSAAPFTLERPKGTYHGPAELAAAAKILHREAQLLENDLGCPQDIEWAVKGSRVYILQARPITTLNGFDPVTAVWNDSLRGNFLWSATNLMEANPGVLTPFTASLLYCLQEHGGPNVVVKNHSLNGIIGGRFYANISVQVSAFSRLFRGDAHRTYREMSGWWGDIPESMHIPVLPLTLQEWMQGVLPGLMRSIQDFGKYRKLAPGFVAQNPRLCAEFRQKIESENTRAGLAGLWRREIFPRYRETFFYIVAAGSDLQVRLERELRALVGDEDANALLSNLSGLSARLESLGPAAGLGMVLRGEMTRQAYLEAYGHRGVNEGEYAWPRPMEDPQWLERQLEEWTKNPVDVDALQARQRAAFQAAWERFCRAHPRRVKDIRRRLQQAADSARLREAVRSEAVRGGAVLRAFALRAAQVLELGDDIFLLTIDEVLQALEGEGHPAACQHIPLRRETYERYRALPPYPALICGRFDPFAWAADPKRRSDVFDASQPAGLPADAEKDAGAIHGFAGALGVVEGVVRRLDSLDDSAKFQAGEVLVTGMTNIGWTPLFPRAAAIVTDLGAPLSHAAIVARELGIPAVVGCGNATMRLKTGDRVRVDGGRGLVQIL